MIELDSDQLAAVERMVNEPTKAALNASLYGTGKTVVTVEVAERIAPHGVKLIVAPIHTQTSWIETIHAQYPAAKAVKINSTVAGKKALEDFLSLRPGYYLVGREYLATRRVSELIGKMVTKVDFMAYDECQRWANHKSQGYRMMKRMKAKYRLALSATPAGNKFTGMFSITQWLWPKFEGHQSFWTWVADWCETKEDHFAGTVVVGERSPGAFVETLPCYIRLEKDFGDPVESQLLVELSPKERKVYDSIEKTMIAYLESHPLIVKLPVTKRLRLRQASLGELSYDPDSDTVYFSDEMESSKYDAMMGFLKEYEDEPALILTHSAKYAHSVAHKMKKAGLRAALWNGDVSAGQRDDIKKAFMAGELDYIVATIASIGEGTDGLQRRARLMVWLSREDNMMLNEQAFRRLHRRGQERTVLSVDVVAVDTYDSGQLSALVERALQMNKSLKKNRNEE